MAATDIKKITICGFGLIGGSMALDFLKSRDKIKLYAFDKPNVLKSLKRDKRFKISCESSFIAAVCHADIIILAAPHKA
ncbi:MAG: NAD(P)-binding domain-containing protein, partial [Candidatus Zixiibacteriota bacterium]